MRILTFLLFQILFITFSNAQVLTPVKWKFESSYVSGDEFELKMIANMDENWNIYSQFTEDNGPVPTTFEFDSGDHFELLGKVKEEGHKKEGHDPLFDANVIKFVEGPVIFTQRVKVKDYSKPITGYVNFMTCDNARCLPPTDVDYSFQLNKAGSNPASTTKESSIDESIAAEQTSSEEKVTKVEEGLLADEGQSDLAINNEGAREGMLEPVKWTFSKNKITDTEYELIFKADLMEGWAIYSQHTDDNGPLPTEFEFDSGAHFEAIGEVIEKGDKVEGPDPLFDNVVVVKYKHGPVYFTQKVKVNDPNVPITGFISFMSCDDARCIAPPAKDFSFAIAEGAVANNAIAGANVDGNVIDQTREEIKATYKTPLSDCGEEAVARDRSMLVTFILGFLGGLVALLTPCVFPMIPLTVSYFTKSSKDRASGLRNALLYGLSIIVIYVTIGLLITGVFGADALQQLSTDYIANTLFFIIFIVFALSFFGYYEITLPSSWSNKTDSMADKGGLVGIFFMAFTLALVSFSCTGPIIGSALVESATNTMGPLVVMLGFSLALALPFGLFAMFPGWLNSLPRSGSWMTSVKVVLGFLELALALKFLSVADMTMHWGILPYEVFLALWILIFGATTIYLLGWIRFPHDSKLKKMSLTRGIFAAVFLAFTVYLATGFMVNQRTNLYNSLSLMSGLAPPATYNLWLPDPELNAAIKDKYPSYSIGANNLRYFKDYYEGLAYAREVNKPVFLDFTGYGCVNCRKTEEHIWVVDEVYSKLQNDFVLVSLYTDDRTKLDEILVSARNGSKLRNVGNKWADFQIINFEQNSQPLYVMMTPEEKVIAAPRGFKEGAKEYAEYMQCGLSAFEELKQ